MLLKRHAIPSAAVASILMALIGLALWRSARPNADSTEARLGRLQYLIGHPPPAGPSLKEPLRTLRWYLDGRPTMADWMEALRRQEEALLNQGYLVTRRLLFSPGTVNEAMERKLLAAFQDGKIPLHFMSTLRLNDSQIDMIICTSDLPVLEGVLRPLGGKTAPMNP
ncbi:MAG: hypothetical protein JNK85_26720 [Verrucomicrobiales bacterium]|nr:hypothetical protein [Verrucomicrobiales bacterium]